LVLNSICIALLAKQNGAYNLNGSYSEANSSELIINALLGIMFSTPLVCLLLAVLIATFINKQEPFDKRFVKTFLFTLVIIYGITLICFASLLLSY
jgi:phosphotransferase system  glucose/maltose/N-acetylglucosamine-specific IIC component